MEVYPLCLEIASGVLVCRKRKVPSCAYRLRLLVSLFQQPVVTVLVAPGSHQWDTRGFRPAPEGIHPCVVSSVECQSFVGTPRRLHKRSAHILEKMQDPRLTWT